MTSPRRLLALSSICPLICVIASALASGCAAPLQQGGVEVRPGIAQRLGAMCRYGHGSQEMCVAPEEEAEE
jgi:hypothetical protein